MPEIRELQTLNNMPAEWFQAFNTEAEAVEFAAQRGEYYVFHHAPSFTWFVADKAKG